MVDQALAARRASSAGRRDLDLRVGDDVVHAKWGEGVVLDLQGSGDKTEVRVNFPTVGREAPAPRLGAAQEGLTADRRRTGDGQETRRVAHDQ